MDYVYIYLSIPNTDLIDSGVIIPVKEQFVTSSTTILGSGQQNVFK